MTKEIDLKEQRKLQVQGLSYIKKICDENEIPYFLANGTLLGAVKYNGYIPWDDDIDICLKRKDYIKLLEVMENEKNEEYELLTIYNTKDYYYPYAKLVNKKTIAEGSYDSAELIVTIITGRKVANYALIIAGLAVLLTLFIILRNKFKK